MGNKDIGRQIASLPFDDYTEVMGGNVDRANWYNTGVSFTNAEVVKYFRLLRDYALNRIHWVSNQIPQHELRLIEWMIFHYGRCAMLIPRITNNNVRFTYKQPMIYQFNISEINTRTMRPIKISIISPQNAGVVIDVNYEADEFVIFTDEYLTGIDVTPFRHIAWEFACKLHELDLAFNANSHRQRMPFVFNNADYNKNADGTYNPVAVRGLTIAEIMRSAFGRNEQFVEVPEHMVGANGFMHEPQYVSNEMLNYIDAQNKLYLAYFERLGLYTNKEKGGSYVVKREQENGDETGDYITKTIKSPRTLAMREASLKFGIDLAYEVVE